MKRTASERLFEKICDERHVSCRRLQERDDTKTPDYLILLEGQKVVVEVKQLDLNPREREIWERIRRGEVGRFHIPTKERIREKIQAGSKQLKSVAKGRCPSILVLLDNTGGLSSLDSDDILSAMYGDEVFDVMIPEDPTLDPFVTDHRFGGGRRMTSSEKCYISGLGRIRKSRERDEWCIDLFHNVFADSPLFPEVGAVLCEDQFTLAQPMTGGFQGWIRIEMSA